jgi:RNA polymerase sigma-70 factor (ECF subfamily)
MDPTRAEDFVRLLTAHQNAMFRYVLTLVPNEEDARDVLQETTVALYRKFDSYDPERPFLAWAYQFAYLEVLKHRDRVKQAHRAFRPEVVDRLARDREQLEPVLEARAVALEGCLQRLPPADRELIDRRYRENIRPDVLAAELGTSRRTLFRNLDRVRRRLLDCITRHSAAEPN